jgi:UDP-N-acetylmuramoyl-L-alanyl-D-glutamate--2,6-diaminopimelate ligase
MGGTHQSSCAGEGNPGERGQQEPVGAKITGQIRRPTLPTLASLLSSVPDATLLGGDPATLITGISFDSRRVKPGELFVAIPGFKRDGREFIRQAVERGAAAVAAEAPLPKLVGPARIELRPGRARGGLADLAAAFFGQPSRELTLVGVTGTDGKTSTTQLLASVLETAGRRTGWLTTVDLKIGADRRPNDLQHTTPEAIGVQAFLREAVEAQVEVAVLEVSSHALALERVRGCAFDLAVFTNLSPEHLNFHGSLAAYLDAKAELFRMLGNSGPRRTPRVGVINADDPSAPTLQAACPVPTLTYGLTAAADVSAEAIELEPGGAAFRLITPAGRVAVRTRLLGRFNVLNWLAAATAAHALGVGPERVAEAAATLPPIRGRMEPLERGQPFAVVVDFAHTPQALATALRTLRQHTPGRLLLAFGNAGERDPASRPAMGRQAAELADFFVITMDDPLHEEPAAIAAETAAGAEAAGGQRGRDFEIELDRREAIRLLLARARPGDAVLLAGKGHEPRMLIGDERLPWDDRAVAEELLDRRDV